MKSLNPTKKTKTMKRINKNWYKVTFYANMSEEDLKAMNSDFYPIMDEVMGIPEVEGLQIDEEIRYDII